jgi:hypothetical protein
MDLVISAEVAISSNELMMDRGGQLVVPRAVEELHHKLAYNLVREMPASGEFFVTSERTTRREEGLGCWVIGQWLQLTRQMHPRKEPLPDTTPLLIAIDAAYDGRADAVEAAIRTYLESLNP